MSKEMETLSDAERRDRLRKTERRERTIQSQKKKAGRKRRVGWCKQKRKRNDERRREKE